MAQTGYTPILIYASSTPGNTPSAANLTSSASGAELALNYADGRLYYKDGSGNVQILAVKMPSGVLPIANGGTNATATPTAGAVAYGTGTAYAFSSAGSSGQVLVSGGTGSPTWSNLSSIGVTTFNAGTTGFTPSTATSGAVTLAGTLATTNGGTGLTSFTANGVVYASSTSALTTGSALTFDGTNLGIGTSSPANTLEIYNASNTQIRVRNGASSLQSYDFGRNGSTGLLTFYGNQTGFTGYVFSGIDGERMRIDSSGNLLVGTTIAANPNTQKMVIKYQSTVGTVNSHLALVGDSATNGQGPQILFSESGDGQNYAGGTIGFVRTGSNSIGDLVFGTRGSAGDSTTVATERMRIDSSGNVGIGTSSPDTSAKLHVLYSGSSIISDPISQAGIVLERGNGAVGFNLITPNTSAGYLNFGDPEDSNAGRIWYDHSSNFMGFGTNNSAERMRIDSSGNVGIGTSLPSYKLTVSGYSNSNSANKLAIGGTADYQALLSMDSSNEVFTVENTTDYANGGINFKVNGADRGFFDISGNFKFNSGYGSVATAYGCRAWVNFNGTGTVAIRASGNVSSITDIGTGTYTVNFTTAMPDANYSGQITSGFASGVREDILGFAYTDAPYAMATGSFTAKFVRADTNASIDTNFAMVAIFR